MSPADFAKVRREVEQNSSFPQDDSRSDTMIPRHSVEGRPYLPTLMASTEEEGDLGSIRTVVGEIFQLSQPSIDHLHVQSVSGGITNKLFHVDGIPTSSTSKDIPSAVLVRIFGGAGLIDRDVETSTFASLGQQGMALTYYGRFGNGRVEEWLPKAHTLQPNELPNHVETIAHHVGRLHSQFRIPEGLKEYHNPLAPPTLWTQLTRWLDQAQAATFSVPADHDRASDLPLDRLAEELIWLQQTVCPANAAIGFCHNDLLAANILLLCDTTDGGSDNNNNDQTKMIQLIDFEYGGMNYLAYDIANHFNEFAGGTDTGTPDYSRFPSRHVQQQFCQAYLGATTGRSAVDANNDVQHLLLEIQGFVLANHLVWGLWAVNQAATEGCHEFDYLLYASCRLKRYFEEKATSGWSP